MRKELLNRAEKAVEIGKKAGANDVWASASRSRSVSYQYRDGSLEQVSESTSRSLGVALYVDGRYAVHATTDLRPEKLDSFVERAVAMTRALQADPFRKIPDPALFAGRPDEAKLELYDPGVDKLDRDQRTAWCREMDEASAGHELRISATSSCSDGHGVSAMVSSNGFSGSRESSSLSVFTEITLRDGDKRPQDYFYCSARHVGDMMQPRAVAEEALRRVSARIGESKGPTARTTLVVDRHAGRRLVGRLLGPARGRAVQQNQSFWTSRLGTKAVSDKLTIVDDPLIPRGLGSRTFDSEGISAKRMSLIDKGVFSNLYLDTYYARKLGKSPTTGDSSNTIVEPGTRGFDEIVAGVDNGIYATSWLGGNMDANTGDFSMGVRGFVIEGGKLGAPIGEMNLTGNAVELFSRLVEVGNDPWLQSSMRVPTLVFEDVQFSGSK